MYVPEVNPDDVESMKSSLEGMNNAPVKKTYNNEMREKIIEILSHRLKAKVIFNKIDCQTLQYINETLNIVLDKKMQEEEIKTKKQELIQKTIEEIKEKLIEKNLSVTDLMPNGIDDLIDKKPKRKKTRHNILYKFHYHIFGKDYFWSGKGYIPRTLRCHLSKGHTLESCYMNQNDWFTSADTYTQKVPEMFQKEFIDLLNNAERMNIPRKMKDTDTNFMI